MICCGIDPGFATGGASTLREKRFVCVQSMSDTVGDEPARVDAATAWFCGCISTACDIRLSPDEPLIVVIENQHGAAFAKSKEHGATGANAVWVREVVGGVRRHCYSLGIPVRLINPQQWRTALGLRSCATKQQAWDALCRMHPELRDVKTNEHGRDSAVIAHVGSLGAHLWAAEQRRVRSRGRDGRRSA